MKKITFNFPDNFEIDEKEILMIIASQLYKSGKLSLGQAAEITGMDKRTFAEALGKNNVSIFNFPESEISRDVKNA